MAFKPQVAKTVAERDDLHERLGLYTDLVQLRLDSLEKQFPHLRPKAEPEKPRETSVAKSVPAGDPGSNGEGFSSSLTRAFDAATRASKTPVLKSLGNAFRRAKDIAFEAFFGTPDHATTVVVNNSQLASPAINR
jgi:hypothetical protein